MKKRKFRKSTLRVSKLNSMSAELFLVFLPVGITVEREVLTVQKIFRVGQNSSKSPARLRAQAEYRRFRNSPIPCIESCWYRDSYMPRSFFAKKRGRLWRPEARQKKILCKSTKFWSLLTRILGVCQPPYIYSYYMHFLFPGG